MHVTDEVQNLSSEATDFELLYHINFGVPLLAPGAKLVAPAVDVVPRDPHSATDIARWNEYGPEQPGLAEFVHFFRLAAREDGRTGVLLRHGRRSRASLRFNVNQLPCFTLWKCQQPAQDGYVTGLEPGTNFPNVRSFEERRDARQGSHPADRARSISRSKCFHMSSAWPPSSKRFSRLPTTLRRASSTVPSQAGRRNRRRVAGGRRQYEEWRQQP